MGEDLDEAIESLHKEMEETLGIKYEDIDEYLDKYVDEDLQQRLGKALFGVGHLNKSVYTDVFAEAFANMECGLMNGWGEAMQIYLRKRGII